MGLTSISSVSEMSVLFDSGDGGGFVDASLVAIDGTRYAWRRSSDPDEMTKMLQWIDRQYSGTPSP